MGQYETLNNQKFSYLGESIKNLKKTSIMMNNASLLIGLTLGFEAIDELSTKLDYDMNMNFAVLSTESIAFLTTFLLNKLLSKSIDQRKYEMYQLSHEKKEELENNLKQKLRNVKNVTTLTYLTAVLETFASYLKFQDSCDTYFSINTLLIIFGNSIATYYAFKSGDLLYEEEKKRKEEYVRIKKQR